MGKWDQHWKALQDMNPEDVYRRTSVRFEAQGFYAVVFMNREYRLYPAEQRVEGPEDDCLTADLEFHLLLLTYLIFAQDAPLVGNWVSEKDLKGGSLFFKGPHALPVKPLIDRFGKDPQKFLEIGTTLGGQRTTDYGDAALKFQALPRIPVACVLWAEDDEFPARVTFLFDPSIASYFPLDVVLALVRCVMKNLIVEYSIKPDCATKS